MWASLSNLAMAASADGEPATKAIRTMVAGGAAGVVTKTCMSPLERMKVLFQVQGLYKGGQKFHGVSDAARFVYSNEGLKGFYKGNFANCVRVVPVYALKFSLNDILKDSMRTYSPDGSPQKLTSQQLLAAGGMAGCVQILTTYPLDFVRTRLQLAESQSGVRYKGITDCMVQTVSKEGVSGLFKGLLPSLLSGAPYVGMQMTFYQWWKNGYDEMYGGGRGGAGPGGGGDVKDVPVHVMLLGGSLSGIVAQTISFPTDTIRHRMQANGIGGTERMYTNSFDCAYKMLTREGPMSFYKGWLVNAYRALPGAAIQFCAYDSFKKALDCT